MFILQHVEHKPELVNRVIAGATLAATGYTQAARANGPALLQDQ